MQAGPDYGSGKVNKYLRSTKVRGPAKVGEDFVLIGNLFLTKRAYEMYKNLNLPSEPMTTLIRA